VGVGGLGNMDLWGIIVGIKGQGKWRSLFFELD
jgi:hypothetical protein